MYISPRPVQLLVLVTVVAFAARCTDPTDNVDAVPVASNLTFDSTAYAEQLYGF